MNKITDSEWQRKRKEKYNKIKDDSWNHINKFKEKNKPTLSPTLKLDDVKKICEIYFNRVIYDEYATSKEFEAYMFVEILKALYGRDMDKWVVDISNLHKNRINNIKNKLKEFEESELRDWINENNLYKD